MRRFLLLFFAFLTVGVALALVFREHNGYVLIAYADWRLETSLFFFIAALAALFWLLVVLWRLLVTSILLPRNVRKGLERRRTRKAQRSLRLGLLQLYEGHWGDAEQELVRLAAGNDHATINYLAAARAAQQQDALPRRDQYIERAAGGRDSELAVLLTQAELQIEQRQDAEAMASLTRLREIEPQHPRVLLLLAELCERLGDWGQLRELLEPLRKSAAVTSARWREFAAAAWTETLTGAEPRTDALAAAWRRIPRQLRQTSALQRQYVMRLRDAGGDKEAARVIGTALKNDWDPELVLLFGELDSSDRTQQLASIEAWISQYGEQPELLLAAGRLCLRNKLWGRARSYLESASTDATRPQALFELGRLFDELGQQEDARQAYRQGLAQASTGNA